jgi:hypothetical protein
LYQQARQLEDEIVADLTELKRLYPSFDEDIYDHNKSLIFSYGRDARLLTKKTCYGGLVEEKVDIIKEEFQVLTPGAYTPGF